MFKIKIKPPSVPGAEGPLESPSIQAAGTSGLPHRFKIKQPRQQKIKVKPASNSKIVLRKSFVGGYGYDSEASDREDDPTIESHIMLRFKSGSEADYVRSQIEAKSSMDDIFIKFKDTRNAVVTVQKKLFAAKLVDLPTITEVHKTFDKKNLFKVADVCQMLLVGDRISHEDTVIAVKTHPKDYIWPHGLTPPLRNVRTKRFRQRTSVKTIESVEKEVERLLALDNACEQTTYTIMDRDDLERERSGTPNVQMSAEQDGEYEDEDTDDEGASDYEDLVADLEAQLNTPVDLPKTVQSTTARVTSQTQRVQFSEEPDTPSIAAASPEQVSSDGSDVGSNDDEEITKEQSEKKSGQRALREDVSSLEAVIASKRADVNRAQNPIMKHRALGMLRKLEAELSMKMEDLARLDEQQQ